MMVGAKMKERAGNGWRNNGRERAQSMQQDCCQWTRIDPNNDGAPLKGRAQRKLTLSKNCGLSFNLKLSEQECLNY
jgi:hypothetical protein